MTLLYLIPLAGLYVFFRAVWPVCSRNEKTSFGILIAAGTLFPYFVHYCGGGISSPTLDKSVMLFGEFLFITITTAAFVFMLRDIASCISVLLRKGSLAKNKSLTSVLILAICLFTLTGMYHAVNDPDVKRITIESETLPPEFDGLTIAQLSDLHVANIFGKKRTQTIVRMTNELNPDITVITGDFVDGTLQERADALKPLAQLKATYGVYACEGNHEYYVNYSGWKDFYSRLNITMLNNSRSTITKGEKTLTLLGLNDPTGYRFAMVGPDIKRALQGDSADYRIALVHQPKLAPEVAKNNVDLMLSGHTHGGQTPFLVPFVKAFNNGFVRGRYQVTDSNRQFPMELYVSSGTGLWTGYSLRVGTRNEITQITLKRK